MYFPPSGRISFGGRRPPGPLSQESLPVEEGREGRMNLVLLRRHLLWRPPKVVLPRSQDPGPQWMRRRRRRKCPGKIFGAIILWRRENKWRGKKAQQFLFFVATISFDAFYEISSPVLPAPPHPLLARGQDLDGPVPVGRELELPGV